MKAVRFDRYGSIDVLRLADVPRPTAGPAQALVRVKAAGINPGEASLREGLFAKLWPATFPSGEGTDFAGIVEEVGPGVTSVKPGAEVVGFTDDRASHAEYLAVKADQLVAKPPNVPWAQAGALFVAGTTAYAAVRAVGVKSGETLVVSAAAGGVGSIAVQLARHAGAKVIGLAGEQNHAWLKVRGVIPVTYGDGQAERILAAAGGPADLARGAFVDTFGHGYVELALSLGVKPNRIDTIIDFEAVEKHKVKAEGSAEAASAGVLAELVGAIAAGWLEIPIAKTYPLDQVQDAYRDLERRHTRGKIVLIP